MSDKELNQAYQSAYLPSWERGEYHGAHFDGLRAVADLVGARVNRKRIFVFKTVAQSKDGRPYLVAFPEDQITKVESIWGGQHVYLRVNGAEVKGSFEDLISLLGERIDVT